MEKCCDTCVCGSTAGKYSLAWQPENVQPPNVQSRRVLQQRTVSDRFSWRLTRTGSGADAVAVPTVGCVPPDPAGPSSLASSLTSAAVGCEEGGGGCETVIGSEIAIDVGLTDEATDDFERGKSSSSSSDSLIELGSSLVSEM
uniref:Uncharacterized protein n=1 Tax=Anopheles coluzzii TaxID=1518534 RepID=A0A8W7PKT4_ANOCL